MHRLHLFYPENDLALAQNTANYTPPPAAVKLRRAGATLPLWYGAEGDKVILDGINARWFKEITDRFQLKTGIYTDFTDDLTPTPWGWSKASRHIFEIRGVPTFVLPDDNWIDSVRELSHRRIAADICNSLQKEVPFQLAPPALEFNSFDEIRDFTLIHGAAVAKLPWSSSGRGVIPLNSDDVEKQQQSLEGAIRRQGSIMIEPRYKKILDFAALFNIKAGQCTFEGLSVFDTQGFGSYAGNVLACENELRATITDALGSSYQFDEIIKKLPHILERIIGNSYDGPLGVDMMAVSDADYSLAPAIELNLRMTMGHLCHRFYREHVVDGHRGRFTVSTSTSAGIIDCETECARISCGRVDLAQPGSDFSFIVKID